VGYVTDFWVVLSEKKTGNIKSYFFTVPKKRQVQCMHSALETLLLIPLAFYKKKGVHHEFRRNQKKIRKI